MNLRHRTAPRLASARGALLVLGITALALFAFVLEPPLISSDAPPVHSTNAP